MLDVSLRMFTLFAGATMVIFDSPLGLFLRLINPLPVGVFC